MGNYVHICAGFSKDFAINGFRVGTLFTHNEDLLTAFGSIGYFQTVSTHTQHILTKIIEDHYWTYNWISENRRRLKECYDGLKDAMDAIDVPVTPCQGTMMAWVDFRKYLKEPKDAKAEADLWKDLCDNDKIIFTTGESC
jgi:aspartate/methionine/tyrosine aminotransferase